MKIIQTQCIPYTAQFNSVKLLCHTMRIPVLYVPAVWKFFLLSGRYSIKHFTYLKVTKATLWSLEKWFPALWEAWRGLLDALATHEGEKRQLTCVHWALGCTRPGDKFRTDRLSWKQQCSREKNTKDDDNNSCKPQQTLYTNLQESLYFIVYSFCSCWTNFI